MDKTEVMGVTQTLEHIDDAVQRRNSFDSVGEEAIGGKSTADLPPGYFWSPRFIGSVVGFALAFDVSFYLFIMLANVLYQINADLGPSVDVIWVVLALPLGQAVAFTVAGRLSDIFGRRWFHICANIMVLIGCLIAGRASSISMLIGANIISGLGSAVQCQGLVISGEMVPNNRRNALYAVINCSLLPLTVAAPGVARALTLNTEQSWRWIFYILAIMTFVATVLLFLFYHPPNFHNLHKEIGKIETVKNLDYLGLFLFIGSGTSLLMGISWGGQRYAWRSNEVIATIVAGGVGMIILGFWERFGKAAHPLIPSRIFNRNYLLFVGTGCTGSMIFYGASILLPQQCALLFGMNADQAGWASCALPGAIMLGTFLAGFTARIGPRKWQAFGCSVFNLAFTAGMAGAGINDVGIIMAFSIISTTAVGYQEVVVNTGGPLQLDPHDIGLANGVQYSARTFTSALANSIYVTVVNNKTTTNLAKYVLPAVVNAGLSEASARQVLLAIASGDPASLSKVPGITPEIIAIAAAASKTAFHATFKNIYYIGAAFAACSMIFTFCLDGKAAERRVTSAIDRRLQGFGPAPQQQEVE